MQRTKLRIPPALNHRGFRLLWGGLFISQVGSQMQHWALFWHVSLLSRDPIAVSIIGGVRFAAVLCFSMIGGLTADRYNRRTIMIITQSIAMSIAVALGVLTWLDRIEVWHIYLLSGLQAAAMAFDLPARQSLVPNLVPRDDLPSAFSLQSIAFNTGAIVGPALSGIIIAYLAQAHVYFINAASFLAVIIALAVLGAVPQRVGRSAARGLRGAALDMRDGVRFIRSQPLILSSMILDFFATLFAAANTLLPYFARFILHVNEVGYGWLAAAQSMGAVTVGLVLSQTSSIRRQGRLLLGAVLVFGAATTVFGLGRQYSLVFAALILAGAADSVSTIIRNTIRQLQTPDALRGRMTGINQIFFMGGPQLGEVEAGAVAQAFGVPAAIITGGLGTMLFVVLVALRWPMLVRYDREEPVAVPPPVVLASASDGAMR